MIKKEREIPIKLLKLEALIRRLPMNHPKRGKIEEEIAKLRAGFRGEQSIDYYLKDQKNYFIFHSLRLQHRTSDFFQMDTLLLHESHVIILEIKNASGTLCFDRTFHQLIRTQNGKEDAFSDPIEQVYRHQKLLRHWLAQHQFPNLPVYTLVVISHPSTIIKSIPPYSETVAKTVLHSSQLISRLELLSKRPHNFSLSTREKNKLSKHLIKSHIPANPDVLAQFKLSADDLIPGVQCPSCKQFPMKRKYGLWLCSLCRTTSKDAHIPAINDYELLISDTISNLELRRFLKISSSQHATRILLSLNLQSTGTYRNRRYLLQQKKTPQS
ncbi:nuclease-related domain-containing protein [Metabacillus sp. JX24]|uniref:nuclease-related domain-containing protein n=1 Tax=Metabacillus sp. JX24 TaxID=3240759 RepID=UPI00350F8700